MEKDGFLLDDRHEIFNMYKSQCATCKHFIRDGYCCPAFPDGIPSGLLEGEMVHDVIIPSQTGTTVYEKAK